MACATMKRFEVKFRNMRIFVNAGDVTGALALARVRYMKVYREAGVLDSMTELSSMDTFRPAATAKLSDRY